jgi:hypothetical protein
VLSVIHCFNDNTKTLVADFYLLTDGRVEAIIERRAGARPFMVGRGSPWRLRVYSVRLAALEPKEKKVLIGCKSPVKICPPRLSPPDVSPFQPNREQWLRAGNFGTDFRLMDVSRAVLEKPPSAPTMRKNFPRKDVARAQRAPLGTRLI